MGGIVQSTQRKSNQPIQQYRKQVLSSFIIISKAAGGKTNEDAVPVRLFPDKASFFKAFNWPSSAGIGPGQQIEKHNPKIAKTGHTEAHVRPSY
jgi:hypothetical protein